MIDVQWYFFSCKSSIHYLLTTLLVLLQLQYDEMPDLMEDGSVQVIQVSDLLDPKVCQASLSSVTRVTHLFHCAYLTRSDHYTDAVDNLALMKNVLDVVEVVCKDSLKHVYVQVRRGGCHLSAEEVEHESYARRFVQRPPALG
jgi:hypothetical protein